MDDGVSRETTDSFGGARSLNSQARSHGRPRGRPRGRSDGRSHGPRGRSHGRSRGRSRGRSTSELQLPRDTCKRKRVTQDPEDEASRWNLRASAAT